MEKLQLIISKVFRSEKKNIINFMAIRLLIFNTEQGEINMDY